MEQSKKLRNPRRCASSEFPTLLFGRSEIECQEVTCIKFLYISEQSTSMYFTCNYVRKNCLCCIIFPGGIHASIPAHVIEESKYTSIFTSLEKITDLAIDTSVITPFLSAC